MDTMRDGVDPDSCEKALSTVVKNEGGGRSSRHFDVLKGFLNLQSRERYPAEDTGVMELLESGGKSCMPSPRSHHACSFAHSTSMSICSGNSANISLLFSSP